METNDDATFKKTEESSSFQSRVFVFPPEVFKNYGMSLIKSTVVENTNTDKITSPKQKRDFESQSGSIYKKKSSPRKRGRKSAKTRKASSNNAQKTIRQRASTLKFKNTIRIRNFEESLKISNQDNTIEKISKENDADIRNPRHRHNLILRKELNRTKSQQDSCKADSTKNNQKSESKESSMLETSNLLRKSILLSPSSCSSISESTKINLDSGTLAPTTLTGLETSENQTVNTNAETINESLEINQTFVNSKGYQDTERETNIRDISSLQLNDSESDAISNPTKNDSLIKTENFQIISEHKTDGKVNKTEHILNIDTSKEIKKSSQQNTIIHQASDCSNKSKIKTLKTHIIKPHSLKMSIENCSTENNTPIDPELYKEIAEMNVHRHSKSKRQAKKSEIDYNNIETAEGNFKEADENREPECSIKTSNEFKIIDPKEFMISPCLTVDKNKSFNQEVLKSDAVLKLQKDTLPKLIQTEEGHNTNLIDLNFVSKLANQNQNTELPDLGRNINLSQTVLIHDTDVAFSEVEKDLSMFEPILPEGKSGHKESEPLMCPNFNNYGEADCSYIQSSEEFKLAPIQISPKHEKYDINLSDSIPSNTLNERNFKCLVFSDYRKPVDNSNTSNCDELNHETVNIFSNNHILANMGGPINDCSGDSKNYKHSIYSSPQKEFSSISGHIDSKISRSEEESTNASKTISMLADYLNKAFHRRSEHKRLQNENKSLKGIEKNNYRNLRKSANDTQGVEKPGGPVTWKSDSRLKNIIKYTHKRSNTKKTDMTKHIFTSQIISFNNGEQPQTLKIDCDLPSDTQTINIPIFKFDSKFSINSELSFIDNNMNETSDIQRSENTLYAPEQVTNDRNFSISSEYKYNENNLKTLDYDTIMSMYSMPGKDSEQDQLNESETIFSAQENVELFQNILFNKSTELMVSTILNEDILSAEDSYNTEDLIELDDLKSEASEIIINTLFSNDQCAFELFDTITEIDGYRDLPCNIEGLDDSVIISNNNIDNEKNSISEMTPQKYFNSKNEEISTLIDKTIDGDNILTTQFSESETKSEIKEKGDAAQTYHQDHSDYFQESPTVTSIIKRRGRPPKVSKKLPNLVPTVSSNEEDSFASRNNRICCGNDTNDSGNPMIKTDNQYVEENMSTKEVEKVSAVNTVKTDINKNRTGKAPKRKLFKEDELNINILSHNLDIKSPMEGRTRSHSAKHSSLLPEKIDNIPREYTEREFELVDEACNTTVHNKRRRSSRTQSKVVDSESSLTESTSRNCSRRSSAVIDTKSDKTDVLKCGVCYKHLKKNEWRLHSRNEHNYLAWLHGDKPIDLSDRRAVIQHLRGIVKPGSPLLCIICKKKWNSSKIFWDHVRQCKNEKRKPDGTEEVTGMRSQVRCAVCEWRGQEADWWEHSFREHDYLSWRVGESPLDLNNGPAVQEHLKLVLHKLSKLTCRKCGTERKQVTAYLKHCKTCIGINQDNSTDTDLSNEDTTNTICSTTRDTSSVENSTSQMLVEVSVAEATVSTVKCGACVWEGAENDWMEHTYIQHHYLSFKEGEPPLDLNNEIEIYGHLKALLKRLPYLTCIKCGVKRKHARAYLSHYKSCGSGKASHKTCAPLIKQEVEIEFTNKDASEAGSEKCSTQRGINSSDNDVEDDINLKRLKETTDKPVKCAVCEEQVDGFKWHDHLVGHNYMAWIEGEEQLVEGKQLKIMMSRYNSLTCRICQSQFCSIGGYKYHIQRCEYKKAEIEFTNKDASEAGSEKCSTQRGINSSDNDAEDDINLKRLKETTDKPVKCAVCEEQVDGFKWHDHLVGHNYMAWIEGEEQLVEGKQLKIMMSRYNSLTCRICQSQFCSIGGYKYHIQRCEYKNQVTPGSVTKRYVRNHDIVLPTSQRPTSDPVKCAVCFEEMPKKLWASHLENVHYNLAWFEGGVPFDISDYNTSYLILGDLMKKKQLVCFNCGETRISSAGFYSHIIICQKTEEEIEALKVACPTCERTYLPNTLAQHMYMHRTKDLKQDPETAHGDTPVGGGRRRAAVAAKANIEKITSVLIESKKSCTACNFIAYTAEELDKHKTLCRGARFKTEQVSDYEAESDLEGGDWGSESEESDSPVESGLSAEESTGRESEYEEEGEESRKRSSKDSVKKEVPLERSTYYAGVDDAHLRSPAFREFAENFCQTHFSTSVLFPELRCNKFEPVPGEELARYLPPMTRSCSFAKQKNFGGTFKWKQFELFHAEKQFGKHTFFTGGPVVGISFVPPSDKLSCKSSEHYVSITCHRDANATGLVYDELHLHPGLIQIWSFGQFERDELATFVLGIAHDYGTVWALDWCPSGGWEEKPHVAHDTGELRRVGLAVAACSDGGVYIFAVCDPQQLPHNEMPIYKTKPVMELQLCSEGYGRPKHQATAVQWSVQKGHSVVCVGYANGTVALYNLNSESPTLRTVRDDVVILHPYYDSNVCSTSVTSLQIYPSSQCEEVSVGVFSVKSGKLMLRAGTGAAPVIPRRFFPNGVPFVPYSPVLHLPADDIPTAGLETGWLATAATASRRITSNSPSASCIFSRRAVLATADAQILLFRNMFPDSDCIRRNMLATYEMVPLKECDGDELDRGHLEELNPYKLDTYEKVINKFGVVWTPNPRIKSERKVNRYPLQSITSVAFCPCRGHFNRLAWGGLSGLVYIINL